MEDSALDFISVNPVLLCPYLSHYPAAAELDGHKLSSRRLHGRRDQGNRGAAWTEGWASVRTQALILRPPLLLIWSSSWFSFETQKGMNWEVKTVSPTLPRTRLMWAVVPGKLWIIDKVLMNTEAGLEPFLGLGCAFTYWPHDTRNQDFPEPSIEMRQYICEQNYIVQIL